MTPHTWLYGYVRACHHKPPPLPSPPRFTLCLAIEIDRVVAGRRFVHRLYRLCRNRHRRGVPSTDHHRSRFEELANMEFRPNREGGSHGHGPRLIKRVESRVVAKRRHVKLEGMHRVWCVYNCNIVLL